jgi:hypothetical protein
MIVAVTTVEFFVKGDFWGRWQLLPRFAQYVPELLGVVAVLLVAILGPRSRFRYVRPQYWLVLAVFLLSLLFGVLANAVQPGPVFAGLRTYLRASAWFLLPAVIAFSNLQVRSQLRLLLIISIVQLPLAVQQRWQTTMSGRGTGDWTSGTLLLSSIMSVYLICAMCIAAAMYMRKKLTTLQFLLLVVVMFVPTAINETKGTLILLPVGLMMAFLATVSPGRRLSGAVLAASLVAVLIAVYIPVYNQLLQERRYATPVEEFWENPEKLQGYLLRGEDVGTTGNPGRLDSVVVPIRTLAQDPVHLMFGYGIGNVSDSALGPKFVGEHYDSLGPFLTTSFARAFLELGLLGLGCVASFIWLVFQDARKVARGADDLMAALAGGWTGVTAVMMLAALYKDVVSQSSLAYLFCYLSGLICAARMRRLYEEESRGKAV